MSYLIIILFLVNHNPAIFSVPSGIEKRHKSDQGRLQAQIILMLCQNITILSKTYLLKLSNRETGAASLCLFSSLYCWVWIHIGSNSAIRMYWMSVCPCSCVFGADFEQTCIAQIFVSNLLCFMHQLILNFTTSIRVSMPFFNHSRENFVFDSCLWTLCKKNLLWDKSNLLPRQDDTIDFYSYTVL